MASKIEDQDPLLNIFGSFASGGPDDVAQDKYKYLAEAYVANWSDQPARLSADDTRSDIRQLTRLLAETHPDPFTRGGGMVAFYRRVEEAVAAVPDGGMTSAELLRLLRPVVASVRDGHTAIYDPADPDEAVDARAEAGLAPRAQLWVEWGIVEETLYVAGVYREADRRLLGGRLVAAGGVPFAELAARMGELRGYDNVYNNLVHLTDALSHPGLLSALLEAGHLPDALHVALDLPGGDRTEATMPFAVEPPGALIEPTSAIQLAPLNAARLGWQRLDERTALLRIGPLMWYREAFEIWRSMGYHHTLGHHLAATARHALGHEPPEDIDARIAGVPAATDLFRELFATIRETNVETLLVDLRDSTGGNSLLATTLAWFLYGEDALVTSDPGYQVRRYSPLYYDNNRGVPRQEVEYDFAEQLAWERQQREGLSDTLRAERRAALYDQVAQSPTFAAAFHQPDQPKPPQLRVRVLTSARTYSAGFDVAALLYKLGAELVGVPSSQTGNCFIDTLRFALDHSGLKGRISHKLSLLFPADPAAGHLLRPSVELTWDRLTALAFDPNATVIIGDSR